jgi:hypothetical protein
LQRPLRQMAMCMSSFSLFLNMFEEEFEEEFDFDFD